MRPPWLWPSASACELLSFSTCSTLRRCFDSVKSFEILRDTDYILVYPCRFAAFGGFLFGYDTGYIAGVKAMPFFVDTFGTLDANGEYALSTATDSLITSILSAGTYVAFLVGPLGWNETLMP